MNLRCSVTVKEKKSANSKHSSVKGPDGKKKNDKKMKRENEKKTHKEEGERKEVKPPPFLGNNHPVKPEPRSPSYEDYELPGNLL